MTIPLNHDGTTRAALDQGDQHARSRLAVAALLAVTIAGGLASRRFANQLPTILGVYAGDALWAAMTFWLIALAAPRASTWRLALASIAVTYLVEASQLYHAPWIDQLRSTRLGALALGRGFLVSDLACYAVGAMGAAFIDAALVRRDAE